MGDKSLLDEMRFLRDELNLQLHLMSMELKDEWHDLLDRLHAIENEIGRDLIEGAEELGRAEESFFVGNEEQVADLLSDLRQFKDKHEADK